MRYDHTVFMQDPLLSLPPQEQDRTPLQVYLGAERIAWNARSKRWQNISAPNMRILDLA